MKLNPWIETRKDGKPVWFSYPKYQVMIYKQSMYTKNKFIIPTYIGFTYWPKFNWGLLENRKDIIKVELINKWTDKVEIQFKPKYNYSRNK